MPPDPDHCTATAVLVDRRTDGPRRSPPESSEIGHSTRFGFPLTRSGYTAIPGAGR